MPERIFPPSEIYTYPAFRDCTVEIHRPKIAVFTTPVMVGAGFGANAESMQLVSHELASAGFTAICADFRFGYEPKNWLYLMLTEPKEMQYERLFKFLGQLT